MRKPAPARRNTGAAMNRPFVSFGMLLLAGAVQAADPYPQPQSYPQQLQYPQQGNAQPAYPQQDNGAHPMRALFAQSLASVAQTTSNNAIVALADGLTGAL